MRNIVIDNISIVWSSDSGFGHTDLTPQKNTIEIDDEDISCLSLLQILIATIAVLKIAISKIKKEPF